MKHKSYRKAIPFVLGMLIALAVVCLPIKDDSAIYEKLIRLHVIADSDSPRDQELKLAVRDGIIDLVSSCTEGSTDRTDAEEKIREILPQIKAQAESTLRELGSSDNVCVVLGNEKYPLREYKDFRLPSGEYCSLRIIIGEGQGQNWWCVLFPPLCRDSAVASDELVSAGFTPDEVKLITDSESPKYVLRFKILDLFKSLFD